MTHWMASRSVGGVNRAGVVMVAVLGVCCLASPPASGNERVGDGVAEYALYQSELTDITGQPVGKICILRSFEGSRRRIASLYTNILLLWLMAMTSVLRPTTGSR